MSERDRFLLKSAFSDCAAALDTAETLAIACIGMASLIGDDCMAALAEQQRQRIAGAREGIQAAMARLRNSQEG